MWCASKFGVFCVIISLFAFHSNYETFGRLVPFTPCGKLFNYFESQTYEIFGAMTFQNDVTGKYDLEVNMSIAMKTHKNIRIVRRTDDYNIQNGDSIEYYVLFPYNHTFPKLTSVVFNGKTYCTGPPEEETSRHGVTALSARDHFETEITSAYKTTPKPEPEPATQPRIQIIINQFINKQGCKECNKETYKDNYKDVCGIKEPNDVSTRSEEYPWLCALFVLQDDGDYKFTCAGNLISNKHIITAAHCLRSPTGSQIPKENFLIVIGKHNIKTWATRSTIREVREMYIHPHYIRPADADIAVLVLEEPVHFKTTIQPICIPEKEEDISELIKNNTKGTVVGWERDEFGSDFVLEPRQLELAVVPEEKCLRVNERFSKLSSNRTFCGGTHGAGDLPCTGDSGGGFYINKNGRWNLRGVVSAALIDPTTNSCDVNNYNVFADVSQFVPWITKIMKIR